jgi:hypothetical protein
MYKLEYLIEVFNKHAVKTEANRQEWMKLFQENKPEEPLPEYMKDDFNLPRALASICSEILKLAKDKSCEKE